VTGLLPGSLTLGAPQEGPQQDTERSGRLQRDPLPDNKILGGGGEGAVSDIYIVKDFIAQDDVGEEVNHPDAFDKFKAIEKKAIKAIYSSKVCSRTAASSASS
jgi:hypothetical protein